MRIGHDTLEFSREGARAMGRNGLMMQIGARVSYWESARVLTIEPVNTIGVGNCMVQIPVEDVEDFIEALRDAPREPSERTFKKGEDPALWATVAISR